MYLPSVNNSKISTIMSMSLLANTSFPYSLLINAKYTFHFMQYFRQARQAKHLATTSLQYSPKILHERVK